MAVWLPAEPIAQLNPSNYVNDFAGVLDPATVARLNDLCRQVDEKAHAQIAVVTVKSLDGQDVVSYAIALYQKWGIGAKGKDRGVLILLATQDHKYWTTVGYPDDFGGNPAWEDGDTIEDADSHDDGLLLETEASLNHGNSGGPMFGWFNYDNGLHALIIGVASSEGAEGWEPPDHDNFAAGGVAMLDLIGWARANMAP